jgi:ribosomal protein L27
VCSPATVGFDGANFLVVGENGSIISDFDIYGARVTPGGTVFDGGRVVRQQGHQWYPELCCGNGSQMLLVYQGWTGTVDGKGYNTYRIWGKMNPNPAIAELTKPEVRMTNGGATIVRGVLFLPRSLDASIPRSLLDISGRKVLDLHPGANDVRALAPGVYFVRQASSVRRDASSITKIVVTR